MAQVLEIYRYRSDTLRVTVTDANDTPYTSASGEKFLFGVKRKLTDKVPAVVVVSEKCENGVVDFVLKPDTFASLEPGKYFYDVGMESGSVDYFPIIDTEPFELKANVTKRGDAT